MILLQLNHRSAPPPSAGQAMIHSQRTIKAVCVCVCVSVCCCGCGQAANSSRRSMTFSV